MANNSVIPGLQHVDHIGLTVPDLDAGVEFYTQILGGTELYRLGPLDSSQMPTIDDGRDWADACLNVKGAYLNLAMLAIGPNLMLELFQYDKPTDKALRPPRNCDPGGHHIAFKVDDIRQAIDHLAKHGCEVMKGPIPVTQGPSAGLLFCYVLDPWGNQMEFVQYDQLEFMDNCEAALYSTHNP
jgi:glyoxylase I family protein